MGALTGDLGSAIGGLGKGAGAAAGAAKGGGGLWGGLGRKAVDRFAASGDPRASSPAFLQLREGMAGGKNIFQAGRDMQRQAKLQKLQQRMPTLGGDQSMQSDTGIVRGPNLVSPRSFRGGRY
jgi:hypothetical protein